MGTLTAFAPLDMLNYRPSQPTSSAKTATKIMLTSGTTTDILSGSFLYAGDGQVSGVVQSVQVLNGGTSVFTLTSASVDAQLLFAEIDTGRIQSAFALALSGDDVLNGSSSNDVLTAFAGNDLLVGGLGSDVLDGGFGTDTASFASSLKNFVLAGAPDHITVIDRSQPNDVDTLISIEGLLFSGTDAHIDPTWLTKAARLDEARFVDLIEMYVAYFNRAPDALGLQYWASRVFDGMALSQVAKSFFVQPETQVTFPATMSTTQFVWQVYYNALGRTPDAAGLAYWVGDLDSGAQTRDAFMLAMIYGARAPSGSKQDAQYLANKGSVGGYFALDKGLGDTSWAKTVMKDVDATAASVSAARATADGFAVISQTTDPHLLVPLTGVLHYGDSA
ncbi:MAG: DUF4214 domain-containing protein [Reyranellaceae bacterium]